LSIIYRGDTHRVDRTGRSACR